MPDTPNPMLMWIASEAGDETASRARTAFGTTYRVMLDGDTQRWQALHFAFSLTEYISGSPFPDEATARAACEADYRERMRKAGWVSAGAQIEIVPVQSRPFEFEDACLCSDCPPDGYPTDATRCEDCPRNTGYFYGGVASTPLATTPVDASESPSGSDNAVPAGYVPASEVQRAREKALEDAARMVGVWWVRTDFNSTADYEGCCAAIRALATPPETGGQHE